MGFLKREREKKKKKQNKKREREREMEQREKKNKTKNKFWGGSVLDTYVYHGELPQGLYYALINLIWFTTQWYLFIGK